MRTKRVEIDLVYPQPEVIREAAAVVRRGGIVALPTETLYGLGADPFNPRAVERIYQVKGRDHGKPLILLIRDLKVLDTLAKEVPTWANPLINHFWPGPLTLLFKASPMVPAEVLGGGKTIGLRISSSPVVRALLERVDAVTGPSANRAGASPLKTGFDVFSGFRGKIDLVLDGGQVRDTTPSTVVDLSRTPLTVIREGSVPLSSIEGVLANF